MSTEDQKDQPDQPDQPSSLGEDLYCLVKDSNWHRVTRFCQAAIEAREQDNENPQDDESDSEDNEDMNKFQYTDSSTGETVLHVACKSRPPVRVIRSLLEVLPHLPTVENVQTEEIPLHLACHHNATLDVLRALVKDHPQTVCFQSKQPVAKKKKFSRFAQNSSSSSTEFHPTPIRALWDGRTTIDTNKQEENYNTVFWQKAQALLEALARHQQYIAVGEADETNERSDPTDEFSSSTASCLLVHASVHATLLDAPTSILDFALDKVPEQCRQRDLNEQVPLHVAIGRAQWTEAVAAKQFRFLLQDPQVISKLLSIFPHAATLCDVMGRFPLHTAVANQHTWHGGVKDLFLNAPEAVFELDPMTQFYPFQMAAIPVRANAAVDLDTIFCLLRVQPGVFDPHAPSGTTHLETSNALTGEQNEESVREATQQATDNLSQQADQMEEELQQTRQEQKESGSSMTGEHVWRRRQVLEIRTLARRMQEKLEILSADGQRRAEMVEMRRQAMDQILQQAKLDLRQTVEMISELGLDNITENAVEETLSHVRKDVSQATHEHNQQTHQLGGIEALFAAFKKQRRPVVVYLQKCESWLVDRAALEEMNKLDDAMKEKQEFLQRASQQQKSLVDQLLGLMEQEKEQKNIAAREAAAKKIAAEQEKVAKEKEQEALAKRLAEEKEQELKLKAKHLAEQEKEKRLKEEQEALVAQEEAQRAKEEQEALEMLEAQRAKEEQEAQEEAQRAKEELEALEEAQRAKEEQEALEEAQTAKEEQEAQEEAQRAKEELEALEEAQRAKEELEALEEAQRAKEELEAQEEAQRVKEEQEALEEAQRAKEELEAQEEDQRAQQEQEAMEEAQRVKEEQEGQEAQEEAQRTGEEQEALVAQASAEEEESPVQNLELEQEEETVAIEERPVISVEEESMTLDGDVENRVGEAGDDCEVECVAVEETLLQQSTIESDAEAEASEHESTDNGPPEESGEEALNEMTSTHVAENAYMRSDTVGEEVSDAKVAEEEELPDMTFSNVETTELNDSQPLHTEGSPYKMFEGDANSDMDHIADGIKDTAASLDVDEEHDESGTLIPPDSSENSVKETGEPEIEPSNGSESPIVDTTVEMLPNLESSRQLGEEGENEETSSHGDAVVAETSPSIEARGIVENFALDTSFTVDEAEQKKDEEVEGENEEEGQLVEGDEDRGKEVEAVNTDQPEGADCDEVSKPETDSVVEEHHVEEKNLPESTQQDKGNGEVKTRLDEENLPETAVGDSTPEHNLPEVMVVVDVAKENEENPSSTQDDVNAALETPHDKYNAVSNESELSEENEGEERKGEGTDDAIVETATSLPRAACQRMGDAIQLTEEQDDNQPIDASKEMDVQNMEPGANKAAHVLDAQEDPSHHEEHTTQENPTNHSFENEEQDKVQPSPAENITEVDEKKDEIDDTCCSVCGMESGFVPEGMLSCERCQEVSYCSKECLQFDWKSGGHQETCVDKREGENVESAEEDVPEICCAVCGLEQSFVPEGMKTCDRCKDLSYCSVECLKWDWNSGGHSEICVDTREPGVDPETLDTSETAEPIILDLDELKESEPINQIDLAVVTDTLPPPSMQTLDAQAEQAILDGPKYDAFKEDYTPKVSSPIQPTRDPTVVAGMLASASRASTMFAKKEAEMFRTMDVDFKEAEMFKNLSADFQEDEEEWEEEVIEEEWDDEEIVEDPTTTLKNNFDRKSMGSRVGGMKMKNTTWLAPSIGMVQEDEGEEESVNEIEVGEKDEMDTSESKMNATETTDSSAIKDDEPTAPSVETSGRSVEPPKEIEKNIDDRDDIEQDEKLRSEESHDLSDQDAGAPGNEEHIVETPTPDEDVNNVSEPTNNGDGATHQNEKCIDLGLEAEAELDGVSPPNQATEEDSGVDLNSQPDDSSDTENSETPIIPQSNTEEIGSTAVTEGKEESDENDENDGIDKMDLSGTESATYADNESETDTPKDIVDGDVSPASEEDVNITIPLDPWASDVIEKNEKDQEESSPSTTEFMLGKDLNEIGEDDDEEDDGDLVFDEPEEFDGTAYLKWLEDDWEEEFKTDASAKKGNLSQSFPGRVNKSIQSNEKISKDAVPSGTISEQAPPPFDPSKKRSSSWGLSSLFSTRWGSEKKQQPDF